MGGIEVDFQFGMHSPELGVAQVHLVVSVQAQFFGNRIVGDGMAFQFGDDLVHGFTADIEECML